MASKKIKKAIGAALVGLAGAKLLGSGAKAASPNIDKGRGSELGKKFRSVAKKSNYKDSIMSGGSGVKSGKIGTMDKIKNFLSDEVFTTTPKTKAFTIPKGTGNSNFGLGAMDGAKYGKMIKASNGTMVMSRGCKLGKHKATKIT